MTLPNKITFARFALAALGVAALLTPALPHHLLWALGIFVAGALSDYADGFIARRSYSTSDLGAFMDPLADKILVLLYFAVLTFGGLYPLLLFLLVLARDLFNDAYRNYAASQRVILGANRASKVKTALQMFSISLALLVAAAETELPTMLSFTALDAAVVVANGCMLLALIIGVIGTVQFIRTHSSIISGNE